MNILPRQIQYQLLFLAAQIGNAGGLNVSNSSKFQVMSFGKIQTHYFL